MSLNIKTGTGREVLASLGGNVINGAEMQHYSTEERMIGYWTNGKPLYRKTFAMPDAYKVSASEYHPSTADITDIWSLIDNVVSIRGTASCFYHNDWQHYSLPYIHEQDRFSVTLIVQYGNIIVKPLPSTDYEVDFTRLTNIFVTLEYTKTADTPITNNNTYSTYEVLTGKTWIDGKPIYRKVATGTFGIVQDTYMTYFDTPLNNLNDVEQIVNLYGLDNNGIIPDHWIADDKMYIVRVFMDSSAKIIKVGSNRSDVSGQSYTVIFEYTKTTD